MEEWSISTNAYTRVRGLRHRDAASGHCEQIHTQALGLRHGDIVEEWSILKKIHTQALED